MCVDASWGEARGEGYPLRTASPTLPAAVAPIDAGRLPVVHLRVELPHPPRFD